jgi:membrane-bound ClpP family serine protease
MEASLLLICVVFLFILMSVLMLTVAIRVVPEHKRLSVFRLGRYIGEKGPGLVILMPILDRAVLMDVSDQVKKLEGQQKLWDVTGNTLSPVHFDGSVEISGEHWNAVSKTPLAPGARVRVVKVILEVETV